MSGNNRAIIFSGTYFIVDINFVDNCMYQVHVSSSQYLSIFVKTL